PEIAPLLHVPPRLEEGDPIETAARLNQAGLDLLYAIASPARPVVIVLDNLQWATAVPIEFIDSVLTDERLSHVLMVGAYRDTEVDEGHPLSAMVTRWERLRAP